jgi:hypothetical protein
MVRPHGSAPALAALQHAYGDAPFRLSEAAASGLAGRTSIRSCLRAGQLVRVRPGVAITRPALERLEEVPRDYLLAQARAGLLGLGRPGWACLTTAGTAHDVPLRLAAGIPRTVHVDVPGLPDALLEPLEPPPGLPEFVPVRVHGTGLPYDQRGEVDGLAATSLVRTAVDLARDQPLPVALVPMDAALRRLALAALPHGTDPRKWLPQHRDLVEVARAELAAVVEGMCGWPGVIGAREAIEHADAAAESPLESCSRGHVVLARLPRPEVGGAVRGDDGETYYGDLVWRGLRVIGEADGWGKYELGDADALERLREEKRREDTLRRAGWIIVRWTSDELQADPRLVITRIVRALAEARQQPARAGVPT